MLVKVLGVVGVMLSIVNGYASWGLQYSGTCSKSNSNANITNCNSHAYTENMIATINEQHGVDFFYSI